MTYEKCTFLCTFHKNSIEWLHNQVRVMEHILDLQLQSSVAKLLATENITVTHNPSLTTAYFDVGTRTLGLPIWKNMGKVVYDMLVGHEVGHALYTPHEGIKEFNKTEGRANFDILNVVEDIRIERLMKLKYAGMPRIFNGAYKTLVDSDFFSIKDKNLAKLNFIDRLNIKGKIGNFVDVPMNEKENDIYDMCLKAETFDDVMEIYHIIKDHIEESQEQKEGDKESSQPTVEGDGESGNEEANQVSSNDEVNGESQSSSGLTQEQLEEAKKNLLKELDDLLQGVSNGKPNELTHSETQSAFNQNMIDEDAYDQTNKELSATDIALWPSQKTVEDLIIPYKDVIAARAITKTDFHETYQEKLDEYKKNINDKVSVLVREFERRKAAYQYSRAQESRRGTIDVEKIYKYRYDDQIFSSVMHLADAKSHGMIMFIDYSGSMGNTLAHVLDHTLNLLHFCKKVGIPFEVYGFTSNIYSYENQRVNQSEYEFSFDDISLVQLFSDKMSKAEYEKAFEQISVQVLTYKEYGRLDHFSKYERLGGTPLDHTLIAAYHIINMFKKRTAVQRTNVIVLSDGDSHYCATKNIKKRHFSKPSISTIKTIVGKKQYSLDYSYRRNTRNVTSQFVSILKKTTGAKLIGFFIAQRGGVPRDRVYEMAANYKQSYSTLESSYKKEGFAYAENCYGYDSYIMLKNDMDIVDDDFEFTMEKQTNIAEDKTAQTKLAKTFAKHNKKNRQNRIIMTKFAEIIA